MTNSEVLQFIIEELSKTEINWTGQKGLFELICAPLSFGNDIYIKRTNAKQVIFNLFKSYKNFDKTKFQALADNIVCGENEAIYTKELFDFLNQQIIISNISIDIDLEELIRNIPCKNEGEKNYAKNFNHWKKGRTKRIGCRKVKQRLEQNFDFPPSLWDKGEIFIKTSIRDGVKKFVKKYNNKIIDENQTDDRYMKMNKRLGMLSTMTNNEKKELDNIKNIDTVKIMEIIGNKYTLKKHYSQEFIQKVIPILYTKGDQENYDLILNDFIPALDIHKQEIREIIEIQANIYNLKGEYRKSNDLLSKLKAKNIQEKIDIETNMISNIRRHKLLYTQLSKEEKIDIIKILIAYYEEIFKLNDTYNYYPAINLAYLQTTLSIVKENEINLNSEINTIYKKAKASIKKDKDSQKSTQKYYAYITDIEFMLLKGTGSPIAELERLLDMEGKNIYLTDLVRTQRQMMFFVDTIIKLSGHNTPIIEKVQNAIDVIDDFIEYKSK